MLKQPLLCLRGIVATRRARAVSDQAKIAQPRVQHADQACQIIVRRVEIAPQHLPPFSEAAFAVLLQQCGFAVSGTGVDEDQACAFPLRQLCKQGRTFQLPGQGRRHQEFAGTDMQLCSLGWFVGTTFKTFHASYLWLSSCRGGAF
ncbi:hypothetical protein D3C85_726630 [compost metagenome]